MRTVSPGAAIVEIGCGGGSRYLAARYEMLGVELSSASVRAAAAAYPSAIQATVDNLPLASACADALISSFVLEHIPDDQVVRSLSEMRRVLRTGGVMLHCFDLDADGPFHTWAKRQSWFRRIFVDSKGHLGLRTECSWRRLFKDAGFTIEHWRPFCKTWFQDLSIWASLDDPEIHGLPRRLGASAAAVNRRAGAAADVASMMFMDTIEPWLPNSWAAKSIAVLRVDS